MPPILWLWQANHLPALAEVFALERNPDVEIQGIGAGRLRLRDGGYDLLAQTRSSTLVQTRAVIEHWVAGTMPDADLDAAAYAFACRTLAHLRADRSLGGRVEALREAGSLFEAGASEPARPRRPTGMLRVGLLLEHAVPSADALTRGREVVLRALEDRLRLALPAVADPHRHETMAAALVAVLAAAVDPLDYRVVRNPRHAIDLARERVVAVVDDGEAVTHADPSAAFRTASFAVRLAATAATDDRTGDAVAALTDRVRGALLADPTLGGVCDRASESEEGVEDADVDEQPHHGPALGLTLPITVDYATAKHDPTALPAWAAAA